MRKSNGIIFLLFFLTTIGYSQDYKLSGLINTFDHYRKNNYIEKVYVHHDRPSYLTGETMWFKLYLVEGSLHTPGLVSKVVYVDVIDEANTSVLECKIEMNQGMGMGSLYLPATLPTGKYTIRAYTNWMKNYSPEFFFHKSLLIINPFRSPEETNNNQKIDFDAQFFPEGGNLIAGIESKIGFQLMNSVGNGVNAQGIIFNERQDTIVTFSPYRFGIGNFKFTPEANMQYHAIIRTSDGNVKSFNLPRAYSSGYALEVNDSDSTVSINIRSKNINSSEQQSVYLIVHSRNRVVKAGMQPLLQGKASFYISPSDLPEGISHFTVFDSALKPMCERLYFRSPDKSPTFSIKSNQPQYLVRQSVKIEMKELADQHTQNELNLSVSVFSSDSLPLSSKTIQNYFLLSSDLKGTVESPEFYLTNTRESKIAADNLMLTHGWSRFTWEDLVVKSDPEKMYMPEVRGHLIQGVVQAEDTLKAGILGYLSAPGKIIRVYPGRSDRMGNMYFEMLNFYGKSKIVAQLNSTQDSSSTLTIPSPFSDRIINYKAPILQLSKDYENEIIKRSIALQVEDIFKKDQKRVIANVVDSSAFYGKPDATYLLDDFTRFPVLEEVLREYVPGVFVRKRKDGFQFLVVDKEVNATFRSSPLILLDGVPIFDEDEIMSFDPRRIKKLEVIQRRWSLGPTNFFGIVSFSTYAGDLGGFELNPKCVVLDYDGLQLVQEFYSPNYENKKQRESRLPDQRTLLYWNPQVITNSEGYAEIEFYTSDIPGEYKVVAEGMSAEGELITSSTSFKVNAAH